MEKGITKQHTQMLYGVAILMMIYHHLFLDPTRLSVKYFSLLSGSMLGRSVEQNIAWFCKLCVAIYAFISGYGLYRSATGSRIEQLGDRVKANYRYVINHILVLMKKYWVIFFLSLPFVMIFEFEKPLVEELDYLIFGLFGLSSKYNSAWWYLSQYIFMLLLYPIIDIIFLSRKNRKNKIVNFMMCIVLILIGGGICSQRLIKFGYFLGNTMY